MKLLHHSHSTNVVRPSGALSAKGKQIRAYRRAFEECDDIADLLERLQIQSGVRLVPGKSCVIFDEVQRYPAAREAIKQLVEYGKYHYIETGSLLGIKENVKDIVIPSEEHAIRLYPIDFDEFLWANGNSLLADHIRKCYAEGQSLGEDLHAKAKALARQHMVVGGMPLSAFLHGTLPVIGCLAGAPVFGGEAEAGLEYV